MIPRATEDTVTGILASRLEDKGVHVEIFPVVSTPRGIRKPDIVCRNSGVYFVEAKFRESDLINAISKVQNDYLNFYDVLGIKGGFAILYPKTLARPMPAEVLEKAVLRERFKLIAMFPPKDVERNFAIYEGSLAEVADVLSKHVLTPRRVEPSTDFIIKTLRESALYITLALKYLSGKDLESLFGGKEVFENILQYEEKKYPVEALRLASAYLLINQILFYHILSRRQPDRFEEIDADEIGKPEDLNRYFKKVLDVNYKTVFSYDVASRIPPAYVDKVKAVINVVKGLTPEKVGGDLLGTIFHDLVPFEVRKNVAAFYTNVLAAELLSWLSIDRHDVKVADFAVGSGGLLVAAYRRKKYLLKSETGNFTQEDHKRFVEKELLGIDVMPFAANVAACHLALQAPEFFTNKVNVAVWDSTELEPSKTIPSIAGLKFVFKGQVGIDAYLKPQEMKKGVVSLTGQIPEEIKLETYDVVIMNPPFTRQERIPKEYKNILNERFKEYSPYLHGQLGYFGYFIFLADRFLKDNGRIAFVLPATVLRIQSCEGIRKLLSEQYHLEHIITTWSRSAFSESARFREILLIARKKKPSRNAKTRITVLKKLPESPIEARELAEKVKNVQTSWEDEKVVVKNYDYSKLRENLNNWFRWISVSNLDLIELLEELLKSDRLTPLSEIAETQRIDLEHLKFKDFNGFILRDASRAIKKNDIWIVNKVENNELIAKHINLGWKVKIPLKTLGRGLRRLSYIKTIDVTDKSDYLILSWFDGIEDLARTLMSVNELKQFNSNIVEKWKSKFDDRKSKVVVGRRFDISAPGTSLIAFYSDVPIVGVDMWSIKKIDAEYGKILTLWLNSSFNLLQILIHRTETRGAWMKIHDYMLKEVKVPKKELTKSERKKLLDAFEKVKNVEFPSILKQLREKDPYRVFIDEIWLKVLGYKEDSKELDKLYDALASEIVTLKSMMREKV